jgi:predicted metalloprotease
MVQYKDKEYELLDTFGLNITTSFIFSWRSRPNPPQETSPRLRREVQQETYNPEGEVNAIQLQHLNATRRFWLRLYKHVGMHPRNPNMALSQYYGTTPKSNGLHLCFPFYAPTFSHTHIDLPVCP